MLIAFPIRNKIYQFLLLNLSILIYFDVSRQAAIRGLQCSAHAVVESLLTREPSFSTEARLLEQPGSSILMATLNLHVQNILNTF